MVGNTGVIGYAELSSSDKWLVSQFLAKGKAKQADFTKLVPLEELVKERNLSIDPQKYSEWDFAYLGLENVEPITGLLTNFEKKKGAEIKSRSKIFYGDDILYGKLRPALNKVFHVYPQFKAGICSTEFFVLEVKPNTVPANVLRFILASKHVLDQVKSLTAGTALPRVHIDDFLKISVPIPSDKTISELSAEVEKLNQKIFAAREIHLNSRNYFEALFHSAFGLKVINDVPFQEVDSTSKFTGELPF